MMPWSRIVDRRNHKRGTYGRGQCEFVHRAANSVPCHVVVTTGETLNIHSYDGVSDGRLRLSTCAIHCGIPRQLDLDCTHVLQAMYPRVVRTHGDDSLSAIGATKSMSSQRGILLRQF